MAAMSMPAAWDCTQTSEIGLTDPLTSLEWDWLNGCLLAKRGICGATYLSDDKPRVLVRHDALALDRGELFDLLYLCGVRPESTHSMP